ncbi:TRAP transporter small permease [Nitratireductor sp. XY-223]|uniref:TRAP transporter small permease n=1 Tax=Nitratireductor sp. XY-223 TaxID=2561926 RepID=UPI00197CC9A7|nr:TRAP transporter small permease [Nitratireductor sp. XY-223]
MTTQPSAPDEIGPGPVARLGRMFAPLEDAANMVAGIAIFVLMVLGIAQIGLRSIFNSPITGYIDLVELSMASMAFLGAAYCQRLGAHIRMELFIGGLRGRVLWAAESLATLVGLGIVGVLIWYGWDHFMRSYQLGDSTIDAEFPVWPSKLLVPVAFSLWFVRLAIQLAGSIRLLINPALAPEGVSVHKDVSEVAKEEIEGALGETIDEAAGTKP